MSYSFTHFRVGSSDIGRLLFANSLSSVLGIEQPLFSMLWEKCCLKAKSVKKVSNWWRNRRYTIFVNFDRYIDRYLVVTRRFVWWNRHDHGLNFISSYCSKEELLRDRMVWYLEYKRLNWFICVLVNIWKELVKFICHDFVECRLYYMTCVGCIISMVCTFVLFSKDNCYCLSYFWSVHGQSPFQWSLFAA